MSILIKTYARKPLTVEAFQFNGERIEALPEWAKAHRGHTAMGGVTAIGKDVSGQLMVPVNGAIETVRYGDYLTFVPSPEGGIVAVFKKAIFETEFDLVDEPAVTNGDLTDAAPAPTPTTETAAPARAVKPKASDTEAKAPEEPTTEA